VASSPWFYRAPWGLGRFIVYPANLKGVAACVVGSACLGAGAYFFGGAVLVVAIPAVLALIYFKSEEAPRNPVA
jgi:hypothetical protein